MTKSLRVQLSHLRQRHLAEHGRRDTTAIDVPSATWLCHAIERERATRVLELGSGFSSWALRHWQQSHPSVDVWTVDDEILWLEKTKAELVMLGYRTDHILSFADLLLHHPHESFDLVFVDLDNMETRITHAEQFVRYTRSGGLLVLDDWQMPHYHTPMTIALATCNVFVHAVPESIDPHGRYLAVGRVAEAATC